jgi:hypothetical protein
MSVYGAIVIDNLGTSLPSKLRYYGAGIVALPREVCFLYTFDVAHWGLSTRVLPG